MTERENLYAAICAAPRDDLPKLVFADWLDEHGDAADRARAELIRIQCEWEADARGNERALEPYRIDEDGELLLDAEKVAKDDPVAGRALALLQRVEELELVAEARSPVELPPIPGFHYEFADRIKGLRTGVLIVMGDTWSSKLAKLAGQFPLRHLTLETSADSDARNLGPSELRILSQIESLTSMYRVVSPLVLGILASQALGHLKRFSTARNCNSSDVLAVLERGEHLVELEEVSLSRFRNSGSPQIAAGLHGNIVRNLRRVRASGWESGSEILPLILPFAFESDPRLEELELDCTVDTDQVAGILARGDSGFSKLLTLGLYQAGLTARGACDLLASENLPALRHLDVGGNLLGDLVGKRLSLTRAFPKLHSLEIGEAGLSTGGIDALVRWPAFAGLRRLVLSGNELKLGGIVALTCADAPHLRTLGLADCGLHGSHIRELVTSTFVRSLWTLDLRGNPLDEAAARALVSSPFLDALQCLYLALPEADPSLPRLRDRFGDRLM